MKIDIYGLKRAIEDESDLGGLQNFQFLSSYPDFEPQPCELSEEPAASVRPCGPRAVFKMTVDGADYYICEVCARDLGFGEADEV